MQSILRIAKRISGPIGLFLVVMGGIWILQGLNLAWGVLARSFMQNDRHWAIYGAILATAGVGLILWGFSKPRHS
jgi:drug/metabolite transporter superfamily protein YnfA